MVVDIRSGRPDIGRDATFVSMHHTKERLQVLSDYEMERLNLLFGTAMMDTDVATRLVERRDATLRDVYGISDDTWHWLENLPARTLPELAQLIMLRQDQSVSSYK